MYTIGVDLGKANDFTAVGILKHIAWPLEGNKRVDRKTVYHLGHLERVALKTPYPRIVEQVGQMMAGLGKDTALVVDATGVGASVVDLFEDAGLNPVGITITGGHEVTRSDMGYNVPKRDLITTTQVLLQTKRLRAAKQLELAKIFQKELLEFQIKISVAGHDSYEAWREGSHDDLVLAVALACWHAENGPGPMEYSVLTFRRS